MDGDVFRDAIAKRNFGILRPGDRVRILYGFMTNMLGTVVRLADRHRCVLNIDGINSGIRVILPADELVRAA